jgi:anti-sigma factor RsiW
MSSLSNDNPLAPSDEQLAFDYYVEQLEQYLDGELEADEAKRVRTRLAEEPAYAASLARLQDQRRVRIDCLCGERGGDDDAAVARLAMCASDLCSDATQETRKSGWFIGPAVRSWMGLAAACLVVGFGIGSLGGLDFGTPPADAVSNPVPEQETTGLIRDNPDRPGTLQNANTQP